MRKDRSTVHVRLTAADKRWLRAAAAQDDLTVSSRLRSILIRELERKEPVRERGAVE